jgi:hypothetical protein
MTTATENHLDKQTRMFENFHNGMKAFVEWSCEVKTNATKYHCNNKERAVGNVKKWIVRLAETIKEGMSPEQMDFVKRSLVAYAEIITDIDKSLRTD